VRPRGRPPASRSVFSFEDANTVLPGELLLDTSFVVEALITSQPLHCVCVPVLVRLAEEEVRIRFSAMLELELAEVAFQLALKENHPRDWKRYRHDGRARPRGTRLMRGVRDAWETVLGYLDFERVEIDDVLPSVPGLMSAHGLASYDAVHAATALRGTPVGIVTTDVGFASLPIATTIYTDNSRLARCRELRVRR
jgi:predicted nucleic acid-binding protein